MSKKIILNNKYELGAGLGCWAKSKEDKHIEYGDTRFIGGILMYAYTIKYSMLSCEVNWVPVEPKKGFDDLNNWMNNVHD